MNTSEHEEPVSAVFTLNSALHCRVRYNNYRKTFLKKKEKKMKNRTHITGTMTNPRIEVVQIWCPGKVDPYNFNCTHYSMQVQFASSVTTESVCPPTPPVVYLGIIMTIIVITVCCSSTFLPLSTYPSSISFSYFLTFLPFLTFPPLPYLLPTMYPIYLTCDNF